MLAISELKDNELAKLCRSPKLVIEATRKLFETDKEFVKAVTQATSDSSAISTRVSTLLNALRNI
jgi:hypothetical protein